MGLRKCWTFGIYDATLRHHSALVGAVDASGKSIFAGKSFTGFSNAEEVIGGKGKVRNLARDFLKHFSSLKYSKSPSSSRTRSQSLAASSRKLRSLGECVFPSTPVYHD